MKTYSYKTYKKENLIKTNHSFNHFYSEYVGEIIGLDAEKVLLLNHKSSYRELSTTFHAMYSKEVQDTDPFTIAKAYINEMIILRAITLFFFNFAWDDILAMIADCKELDAPVAAIRKLNSKKQKMIAIHDYQFFSIFLDASTEGKASIMHYALLRYKEEAVRNIDYGLKLFQQIESSKF
jgi:hypothetical protein